MSRPFDTPLYVIKSDKSALPPFPYCKRIPDKERKVSEKSKYKKGYEVRICLADNNEVKIMQAILKKLGIKTGKSYNKNQRKVLPLYGIYNVKLFISSITKA